jgi:hypothetical protein
LKSRLLRHLRSAQMAVVPRSGTAYAERMQRRDENEVRRSEAEKGRAQREGEAPAGGCQSPLSASFLFESERKLPCEALAKQGYQLLVLLR